MLGLTAKMPKNLLSFLRLCVLLLGFAIICSGAFCISTGSSACKCNNVPIAYFLLPLGFFLLIFGIFWSTYHEASKHKSLFHRIIQQNPRFRDSHINTIDRYVRCGSVYNFCLLILAPLFLCKTFQIHRYLHPFPLYFMNPFLSLPFQFCFRNTYNVPYSSIPLHLLHPLPFCLSSIHSVLSI